MTTASFCAVQSTELLIAGIPCIDVRCAALLYATVDAGDSFPKLLSSLQHCTKVLHVHLAAPPACAEAWMDGCVRGRPRPSLPPWLCRDAKASTDVQAALLWEAIWDAHQVSGCASCLWAPHGVFMLHLLWLLPAQRTGSGRHVFRLLRQARRDCRPVPWLLLENVEAFLNRHDIQEDGGGTDAVIK